MRVREVAPLRAAQLGYKLSLSSTPGPKHGAGNQLETLLIERTDFATEFGLVSGSPSFLSPAGRWVSFLSFAGQGQGQGQVLASCELLD